ncbi:MAG TPA: hypothetical protein VM345_06565 [Acidimicrobiales bacterium]|nr:hypothetical protein [Acidimicrobiales bacterium]
MHDLRGAGWFVGDDVSLPNAAIDHVLVGPAGVLAVQVMWSNQRDERGRADIRARIGARQLQHHLAVRELSVEVVPAVLACGPGQPEVAGGVRVVDGVAFLFDDLSDEWTEQLRSRALLPESVVDAIRDEVCTLLEQQFAVA